eukprot:753255-Rhodomonas_salina.1
MLAPSPFVHVSNLTRDSSEPQPDQHHSGSEAVTAAEEVPDVVSKGAQGGVLRVWPALLHHLPYMGHVTCCHVLSRAVTRCHVLSRAHWLSME